MLPLDNFPKTVYASEGFSGKGKERNELQDSTFPYLS